MFDFLFISPSLLDGLLEKGEEMEPRRLSKLKRKGYKTEGIIHLLGLKILLFVNISE